MEEIRPNEEINGRYVLKQSKGRGTFGQVWLAYDRATDEDVAIKFYVALDRKGREEFIQEFRIAAKLWHSNLLVTKDYGEWQGHPYLTMKYCAKGSAADLIGTLRPGAADELKIWHFIHDVAAGLAYLHSIEPDPIVHQDIKPDNTLVDTDGTFLITDFGISKRIRNTMRKQSTKDLKAGAPAYMGPERFSDNPEPILASDVWSLGASIYELAEGELPFCGMGGVMMSKGAEMPMLSAGWSKNLNDVMHWCLEKETWNRAKAYQVQEVAGKVIDAGNDICVATLISQMIKNEHTPKNPSKEDPRATKPHVNNETSEEGSTSYNDARISIPIEERAIWWKKPRMWIATIGIIAIISVATGILSQRDTPQPIQPESVASSLSATDSLNSITEKPVDKKEPKQDNSISQKAVNTNNAVPSASQSHAKQPEQSTGTINLGYATWNGGIKGGKPNGNGTMTFTTVHSTEYILLGE